MKIVVRGTNWVGDAVMQIPALRHLRRVFPDARITLYTKAWARGIYEDADFIDEILTFEKTDSVFRQAKIWREKKFDLAILLTNSFESALVAKFGKAAKRIGYATENRAFLLTKSVPVPDWKNSRHEIYYYLNLVAEAQKSIFGSTVVSEKNPQFDLKVSAERRAKARIFLSENGVDLSKKIIAFCPGSTNSRAKRWQAESYAKLNDLIQENLNSQIILIGAKDESDVSERVIAEAKIKPISLTGKTSLAELVAVLSQCDLLVSNDTGPAHIAAALGTKTLVIFGPTNPLTTHPIGAEIVRKEVECAPCMLRDCPIDHRCMTQIRAEEVFAKAFSLRYDKILDEGNGT
ncbi:MAG: lipopolysaccharide heptosyltransferase II [Pyrinomonadaceae bacterium]